MRVLRGLYLSLILLVVLALSSNRMLAGLWGMGPDPVLTPLVSWMPAWINPLTAPLHARIWSAVILGLLLVYWVTCVAIWMRRPKPMKVRTTSGGTMMIHPGAILKFVKLQIEGHPAVINSRVRVRQTGNNNIAVRAMISVQPIESLPVIGEQIKAAVRDGLSQVMGIEKIDDITLLLDIDQKNLALKPGPRTEPEPEVETPARAPLATETEVYEPPVAEPRPTEIHFEEPKKETLEIAPEPTEEKPPVDQKPADETDKDRF